LPVRSVEQLYKEQDKILLELEQKSEDLTYKKVLDILKKNNESIELKDKIEEEVSYSLNFERIDSLYRRINNKYDELDEKKKEKIGKLFFEIEKLLK